MRAPRAGALMLSIVCLTGCASGPYQFGHGWRNSPLACSQGAPLGSPQVCQGTPHKLVDGAGWVLGIPSKVLLWDRRVNNHSISPATTTAVTNYIQQNQMPDVCVRVNQYAPGEEWRRLTQNQNVGAGWRYTLGTLNLIGYTILPGRLFGGDRYNPYTNSVYVYSDVPSLPIKAGAYAKDVHGRELPGTYAAVNQLPVVSLWHQTINTNDALGYTRTCGSREQQIEARQILYPSYGTNVGTSVAGVVGYNPFLIIGGAVAGHSASWLAPEEKAAPTAVAATTPAPVAGAQPVGQTQLAVPASPVSPASQQASYNMPTPPAPMPGMGPTPAVPPAMPPAYPPPPVAGVRY